MNRNRLIQMIALLILLACMFGVGSMMSDLNAISSDAQLKYTTEATEGAPIPVVIAQSIGVLRGIIVNYMWIRADNLKQDGKFFEAYHLSSWITQLEPRFPQVWSFHAWNMAYNISVATHTPEERWQWVNSGINLIRRDGIRYNPNEMSLYKELSWCFLHKIGGLTDDSHRYYKQKLAEEWQGLLGKPPFTQEERIEWVRAFAEAKNNIDDIRAEYPEIDALIKELDTHGYKLDKDLLYNNEKLNALNTSYMAQKMDLVEKFNDLTSVENLDPEIRNRVGPLIFLRTIRSKTEYQKVWPVLLNYIRKRILREDYNMDPEIMLDFTENFGPLDWRSPFAHSFYWAAVGVPRGLSRRQQARFDRINTDRLMFHSQQALKRGGLIHYDFVTGDISWGPDLRFIPTYEKVFEIVKSRELTLAGDRENGIANPQTFIDGYRNFLIDAVREYYQWGDYAKAEEYYAKLRNTPDMIEKSKPDRFFYPIQDFIIRETYERYTSPDVAISDVRAMMISAFRFGLARGDKDVYTKRMNQARLVYQTFFDQYKDVKTLFTEKNRLELPTWEDPNSYEWCMTSIAFYEAMLAIDASFEERVQLWNRAPDWLKSKIYDLIHDDLYNTFQYTSPQVRMTITFDEAFPPPGNLEFYRSLRTAVKDTTDKESINIDRK